MNQQTMDILRAHARHAEQQLTEAIHARHRLLEELDLNSIEVGHLQSKVGELRDDLAKASEPETASHIHFEF